MQMGAKGGPDRQVAGNASGSAASDLPAAYPAAGRQLPT